MAEVPTLPDILDAAIDRRLEGVHTACPGVISAYDATAYTATVTASLPDSPVLKEVPVVIPGAWASGDPVLLVFCEREFDADLNDVNEARRHGLSGAIAVPLIARAGDTVDFVALAAKVKAQLDGLKSAISGWVPVPNDGGAALQTALSSWLSSSSDVAAVKMKAR